VSVTDRPGFNDYLAALLNQPENAAMSAAVKAQAQAAKYDWSRQARPEQLEPEGEWLIWLLVTGRRWGKTRSAAEWMRKRALSEQGVYAICAPTYGDVRDVCVEGGISEPSDRRSGLISVCAPGEIENYNRSIGEIRMRNGSKIKMLSADEPDRARGWGFNAAWCDELSSWRYPATWYETLLPAVTMADTKRFVITTTPKPNALTTALMKRAETDSSVALVRGRTIENAANLGKGAVAELRLQMTERLARQELEGELLLDTPGAIATFALLDLGRRTVAAERVRTVVSVDPAVTDTSESDETGIAVGLRAVDGHTYLIEDASCRVSVSAWARRAVAVAVENGAGMILYEKNQGADAIRNVLQRALDEVGVKDVVLKEVTASKSKFDRALPLQNAIERQEFHLVGYFPELEAQLTSFTADHKGPSPDRLDAVAHLFNELAEPEKETGFFFGW